MLVPLQTEPACIDTNATMLNATPSARPPVLPDNVRIYRTAAQVAGKYEELALLNAIAVTLFPTTALGAQGHPQTRDGFWINVGLGVGSLGCDDCTNRTSGLSGQISLGGTINPRFLLGASSNGWTKSEDGVTLTMGRLVAIARFYPSATGGLYLNGGLGIARLDLGVSNFGSDGVTGTSAILGVGYDARIRKNVSLSPYRTALARASTAVR